MVEVGAAEELVQAKLCCHNSGSHAILSPIKSRHRLESPRNGVAAMVFVVTRLISAPNHASRHPFECLNTSTLHCATPSRTAAS